MARGFLTLVPVSEALARWQRFGPIARTERVPLLAAVGRVSVAEVLAPEPLPGFDRALMDGFAVRARDTAGARETSPQVLTLAGEVTMGRPPPGSLEPGQAMAVPTGGMLPAGADAVVMIEHTRPLGAGAVELCRAAAPGEHVLGAGQDAAQGSRLLPAGRLLAPADVGPLAAVGLTSLEVRGRPRVAILATGDELVAPEDTPGPGQVRDTNALVLAAQVGALGAEPRVCKRAPDDLEALSRAVRAALAEADLVLLSGGSSVGARDHTARVLAALSPEGLLLAGVAIAPGKPTLAAAAGAKPVLGLPGHPVSSFVVLHVLVAPLVDRLLGLAGPRARPTTRGVLTHNAPAAPGRETWLRVHLDPRAAPAPRVTPLTGDSSAQAAWLSCDGLLRVPAGREGFAEGDEVAVELIRA
jgi:molybdopterin molybdotransferase